MKRRDLIKAGASAAILTSVPFQVFANNALDGLTSSDLIYLSTYKTSGALSKCQAEIWFVTMGSDVLVCTQTDSWRVQAPKKGLTKTKVWIGDVGVWKPNGKHLSLPAVDMQASIETDQATLESALQKFGDKYRSGWGRWGPRFRNGLDDGSRTMLRYRLS